VAISRNEGLNFIPLIILYKVHIEGLGSVEITSLDVIVVRVMGSQHPLVCHEIAFIKVEHQIFIVYSGVSASQMCRPLWHNHRRVL